MVCYHMRIKYINHQFLPYGYMDQSLFSKFSSTEFVIILILLQLLS